MNVLKWIWPSLGEGYFAARRKGSHVQLNASYTKKGPGRRHDHVTKAKKEVRAKAAAMAMLPI